LFMAENEGTVQVEKISLEDRTPVSLDFYEPEKIIGLEYVRIDGNDKANDKISDLINDGYKPEKTMILLGMSTKFQQTNFHKIYVIMVKRKEN